MSAEASRSVNERNCGPLGSSSGRTSARSITKYGGHRHILENIVPKMRRKGLSEELIHAITVGNPAGITGQNQEPSRLSSYWNCNRALAFPCWATPNRGEGVASPANNGECRMHLPIGKVHLLYSRGRLTSVSPLAYFWVTCRGWHHLIPSPSNRGGFPATPSR